MLYSFDVGNDFFQWSHNSVFHFSRRCTGVSYQHIGHWHNNLWFFFPRNQKRTVDADSHQRDHEQYRQLRIDKSLGYTA